MIQKTQCFQETNFKQKYNLKHTFLHYYDDNYSYIPIFQNDDKIGFRNQFYKIIKLQRRTETFLQYKIQNLESHEKIGIEYQYIFDENLDDENQEYYEDQTRNLSTESQLFRQYCKIEVKRNNQDQQNLQNLTRFIHLNNLNQNSKIKLLHSFANDSQLEQLDYNRIHINDKLQMKITKNYQNQVSCFIKAPSSISLIIKQHQTFLIGFYCAILNNLVLFNEYLSQLDIIQQYLQNGIIDSNIQLKQGLLKGAIQYEFKLQIPIRFMQNIIKKLFNQSQLAEFSFILLCWLFIIDKGGRFFRKINHYKSYQLESEKEERFFSGHASKQLDLDFEQSKIQIKSVQSLNSLGDSSFINDIFCCKQMEKDGLFRKIYTKLQQFVAQQTCKKQDQKLLFDFSFGQSNSIEQNQQNYYTFQGKTDKNSAELKTQLQNLKQKISGSGLTNLSMDLLIYLISRESQYSYRQ